MIDHNVIIDTLKWIGSLWNDYLAPYVIIRDYEAGVVLRLGKFSRTLKKGQVNLKWPLIEEVHTCNAKPDTYRIQGNTFATLDGKSATVGICVEYEIEDEIKWLILNNDAQTNFHDICWGTAGELLVMKNWEDIKRKPTRTELKNKIKDATEHLGTKIIDVYFGDIALSRFLVLYGER